MSDHKYTFDLHNTERTTGVTFEWDPRAGYLHIHACEGGRMVDCWEFPNANRGDAVELFIFYWSAAVALRDDEECGTPNSSFHDFPIYLESLGIRMEVRLARPDSSNVVECWFTVCDPLTEEVHDEVTFTVSLPALEAATDGLDVLI